MKPRKTSQKTPDPLRVTPNRGPSNRPLPYLAGILLLALAVRLMALADLSETPYFGFLLWDERIYHEWAQKIAEGTFSSNSVYEFAPLYAYVLGFLYRIFTPDPLYARILNTVLGVAACGLVYAIGAVLAGRRVGLCAGLVAALYKPLILYSIVPLKETLAALCFAVVVYAFLRLTDALSCREKPDREGGIPRRPPLLAAALLGLASGLLINVRPNAAAVIPLIFILPVWLAFRDGTPLKRVGAVLSVVFLGTLIALSPFVIRNYLAAGKIAVTTSQTGFNLYIGNNLGNPTPYYRPVPFATSSPFEQGIQFTIEASRRAGARLTPLQASRYWTAETLHQAIEAPGAFTRKIIQKALATIHRFEAGDHYDTDFLGRFVPTFRLPFFTFGIIFPLAMVGMIRGFPRNRKSRAAALLLAFYALTLVAFFSNGRYRLPMVTVLIPFAVCGATAIMEAVRGKELRRAGALVAAALGFLAMGYLPLRGAGDLTAYYNTHAIILNQNGLPDEAERYWEMSSATEGSFSAFANLSLAAKNLRAGKIERGTAYLNKIGNDSFAAAQKYALMGDIRFSRRDVNGAAEYYEKSLAVNSGQRRTLVKLIRLYRRIDPRRASECEDRLRYVSSFYDLM